MFKYFIASLVILLTSSVYAQEPTKGFDYYLLALGWSPNFCETHQDSEECTVARTFILHGLWPQYEDGGYPHNCQGERVPEAVIQDMMNIMPSKHLIIHEWIKHGRCTGLEPSIYFENAKRAFDGVAIPDVFAHPTRDFELSAQQIVDAFKKANPGLNDDAIEVVCPAEILSEVRFCLNKDDGKTRSCGAGVNSCQSPRVHITAPMSPNAESDEEQYKYNPIHRLNREKEEQR
jgi:ribonuclease T2